MRIVLTALALTGCFVEDKHASDSTDSTPLADEWAATDQPPPPLDAIPPTLANTGIEHGIPFTPRWALYSDGAEKRRWISLPPGAQIDTTNPDYWRFPVGTKLWKEFVRDGVVVETRYMVKFGPGDAHWLFVPYDGSGLPVEDGASDVSGTTHDIPARSKCNGCHANVASRVLGFSQFQLDYDAPDFDLEDAAAAGWLSKPVVHFAVPGTNAQRNTLGYLHANCGHCHNSKSPLVNRPMLRLESDHIATLAQTRTYQSTINVTGRVPYGGATLIVKPGDPDHSILVTRMRSTDPKHHMPALGTETTDTVALTAICSWIRSL